MNDGIVSILKETKDIFNLTLKCIIALSIVIAVFMGVILFKVSKPTAVYNIEHVDTLVLPEEPKVYDKPFTNTSSDIEVYKAPYCKDIQKAMDVSKQTVFNWFKNYLNGIVFTYKRRTIVPDYYINKVINGEVESITPTYKLKALKILINNGELKPIKINEV